jgi:hypothetical protein
MQGTVTLMKTGWDSGLTFFISADRATQMKK